MINEYAVTNMSCKCILVKSMGVIMNGQTLTKYNYAIMKWQYELENAISQNVIIPIYYCIIILNVVFTWSILFLVTLYILYI